MKKTIYLLTINLIISLNAISQIAKNNISVLNHASNNITYFIDSETGKLISYVLTDERITRKSTVNLKTNKVYLASLNMAYEIDINKGKVIDSYTFNEKTPEGQNDISGAEYINPDGTGVFIKTTTDNILYYFFDIKNKSSKMIYKSRLDKSLYLGKAIFEDNSGFSYIGIIDPSSNSISMLQKPWENKIQNQFRGANKVVLEMKKKYKGKNIGLFLASNADLISLTSVIMNMTTFSTKSIEMIYSFKKDSFLFDREDPDEGNSYRLPRYINGTLYFHKIINPKDISQTGYVSEFYEENTDSPLIFKSDFKNLSMNDIYDLKNIIVFDDDLILKAFDVITGKQLWTLDVNF